MDKFIKFFDSYQFEYFNAKEVFRNNPPEELWDNIIPTMKVLDYLRKNLSIPFLINSSYRNPKYNEQVGGKLNSLHLDFNAIDFTVRDKRLLKGVHKFIIGKKWEVDGITSQDMGVGLYDSFIHIDTRGKLGKPSPARWGKT